MQDRFLAQGLDTEQRLLTMLIAAKPTHSPFFQEFSQSLGEIDWSAFEDLIARHRVAALVHAGIASLPYIEIPDQLSARLIRAKSANALKFLQSVGLASKVTLALDEKGIACVILKGFMVASQYYEHPSDRQMIDIDILVAEDRYDDAEQVVASLGFKRFYPDFTLQPSSKDSFKRLHNAYSFCRPGDKLQIDLHWRTVNNPALFPHIDQNWTHMISYCTISGLAFPTLERAPHALYIIVHGAKSGWVRLKWLADVERIIRALTEQQVEEFVRLVQITKLEKLVSMSLSLAEQLLGATLPDQLAQLVRNNPANGLVRLAMPLIYGPIAEKKPSPREWRRYLNRMRYSFSLHGGLGYRSKSLLRELASPADLKIVLLRPEAVWLLAIISPVLGIWRSLRR